MLDDGSLDNWDYFRATRVAGLGLMISANVSFHQLFSWYNTFPSLLNVSDYLAASLITRHDYIKTNDRIQVWIRASFLTSDQQLCRREGQLYLIVSETHLWGSFVVCEHLPPAADFPVRTRGWESSLSHSQHLAPGHYQECPNMLRYPVCDRGGTSDICRWFSIKKCGQSMNQFPPNGPVLMLHLLY